VSGKERLADFWVRYVDRQELVILDDTFDGDHATKSHRHLDGAALPIRKVLSADLAAARVWIDNWQRMPAVHCGEQEPCFAVLAARDRALSGSSPEVA
jgi:hypothetical protein